MNIEFNRNEDAMKMLLSDMRQRLQKIYEGGGKKAIEKQKEKNKLTPRQLIRISLLLRSALSLVIKCMKNKGDVPQVVP